MIDPLRDRLSRLEQFVRHLEELQSTSLKTPVEVAAAERWLQLAAEASLEVGEMLIARFGWERPETYRGVIQVLGENGVLDEDLLESFTAIAGLRNLLVHDYTRIDPGRLLGFLSRLDDFRRFAKMVEQWLEQQETDP